MLCILNLTMSSSSMHSWFSFWLREWHLPFLSRKAVQIALVILQSLVSEMQPMCNEPKLWYMFTNNIYATANPNLSVFMDPCVCVNRDKGRSPAWLFPCWTSMAFYRPLNINTMFTWSPIHKHNWCQGHTVITTSASVNKESNLWQIKALQLIRANLKKWNVS